MCVCVSLRLYQKAKQNPSLATITGFVHYIFFNSTKLFTMYFLFINVFFF